MCSGNYKDLIIPYINVNDTQVTIADIRKKNLEYIAEDEMLYSVETSKATEDYYPHYAGYVVLFVGEFDEVAVGESVGMIFKNLEDAIIVLSEWNAQKEKSAKPGGGNATKKAIAYAAEKGVDISLIKKDGIIKTKDIDDWLACHQ